MSVKRRMMLVVRDAARHRRRTLRPLLVDRPPIVGDLLRPDNLPNAEGLLKMEGPLKLAGPPKLRDLLNADGLRTTAGQLRVDHQQNADALLIVDARLRVHRPPKRSRVFKRIVADPN